MLDYILFLCSGRVQWRGERGEKEGYGEGEETRKYPKTAEQAITFLFDKMLHITCNQVGLITRPRWQWQRKRESAKKK
jgi:hypothetical protein